MVPGHRRWISPACSRRVQTKGFHDDQKVSSPWAGAVASRRAKPASSGMAKAIAEKHEIVVETDESIFTLTADSRDGRLLIQQRRKNGRSNREVCALTLSNPGELADFFDGLRRLLSSTGIRIPEA